MSTEEQVKEARPELEEREIVAYRHSPDTGWSIEPASARRDWMDRTTGRFAYRCLPLVMANQLGWTIRCPWTFEVTWSGKKEQDALKIRFLDGPETGREAVRSNFGHGILSILFPWVFRTPPGVGLLVRGATNHWVQHAAPLEGLVETDWISTTYLMNWQITSRNKAATFRKEEPICMVTPVQLGLLPSMQPRIRDTFENKKLMEELAAFEKKRQQQVRESREAFQRGEKFQTFQLDYMHGETPTGEKAEQHLTNLKVLPFKR